VIKCLCLLDRVIYMPVNKQRLSSATLKRLKAPGIISNFLYFVDRFNYPPIIRLANQSFTHPFYSLLGNWSHYIQSEPPSQMEKELY